MANFPVPFRSQREQSICYTLGSTNVVFKVMPNKNVFKAKAFAKYFVNGSFCHSGGLVGAGSGGAQVESGQGLCKEAQLS